MKVLASMVIFTAMLMVSARAQAQSQLSETEKKSAPTVASVLDQRLSGIEKLLVGIADAMPEDKYSFAPTNGEFKGVRNFGDQLRHVAAEQFHILRRHERERAPG